MTQERENKQRASTEANATGWDNLPNELKYKIIAHAVDDSVAWKAHETFYSVLRASRNFRDLANSGMLQHYKDSLDGGRTVSDAVIETAFRDNNFSDEPPRSDRHIGKEAAAVTPALEFQSPERRSVIFNNIAAKDVEKRMVGYSYIAGRADLFQEHESSRMYREALDTFREGNLASYPAAEVLVKRYDDIGHDARAQLQETVSQDENQRQREDFCDAIVNHNPSLLKHDSLRLLMRENLDYLEDPHEALAQLASYIDKNSLDDTDFIIEKSLSSFGQMTVTEMTIHGEEHGLKAPARAIARVFDGNISPEFKEQITELRRSDTKEGRALASALKELERDRPAEATITGGTRESLKLMRDVVTSLNMPDEVAAIHRIGNVAKSNEKQMNAARKALMNSVCERNNGRGR